MPATEQTWRNQKRLHIVFAVSTAIMLLATLWTMLADHYREWKTVQLDDRKKDAWMIQSRRDSLAAQFAEQEREFDDAIARVDSSAIDPKLIEEFKTAVRQADARLATGDAANPAAAKPANDAQFAKLDERVKELDELAAKAREAESRMPDAENKEEAAGEVLDTRAAAAKARRNVLAEMDKFIREARRREGSLVGARKSANGQRTAAVSALGIKVGEGASQKAVDEVQARIDELDKQIADLTGKIADAKDYRLALESVVADVDASKAQATKDLTTMKTDLARLDEQVYKNTSNLGERITRLPIVNALYSGNVKIDQNWLPDLKINYNFAQVARFDRCTTCHRAISTTAPGTATDPLYPTIPDKQREFTLPLATPAEQPAEGATLEQVYGMKLSEEGIIDEGAVTVHYVLPDTPAARAGIQSGDVIRAIDGSAVESPKAVEQWMLQLATWGKPATVSILRGLDHPFTAHPRLDLYLSDLSPHPQKTMGCTICHDGQGSGTSFQWTSHTPDNAHEQSKWVKEHGWSDNHHWIFPMKPARFVESNCLKCHHQKGGLEPSERFPEPPAPKLVEGWTLVEQYGCFGCHEINGFDSPTVTVGPDVRLEPPFHEAAAQILRDKGLSEEQRAWAGKLLIHPEDADSRRLLMASVKQDEMLAANPDTTDEAKLSADTHRLVSVLKDVEIPGDYRKVGPSLRHLNSKVEYDWLYSWIRKPADFRPSTRMPQFFQQYEHLADDPAELKTSQTFEPIEIRALAEYLLAASSEFEYLPAAEGVTEEASADRGKWLFETRGCLACHSHEAFPGIKSTQGPELSRIGSKLNNDNGRKWLYSWLKQPNHYHARTKMPDLYLDPIEAKDNLGKPTGEVSDPAADIAAFLLGGDDQWKPADVPSRGDLSADEQKALADLAELWLASDAIPKARAHEYLQGAGIPKSQESKLKTDERLLVGLTAENRNERLMQYVGRRTITKYGCFGCHDIPGFEDAKPIGTALVDWGRKETSKLAFENIQKFLETHGIEPENPGVPTDDSADAKVAHATGDEHGAEHTAGHAGHLNPADFSDDASYYIQSLNSHGRDGFLWQKLRYPRSYDYKTTHNKNFNERLRMPRFPFNDGEREAVMTFILGLTKEPPAAKYIFRPDAREQAIVDGREVIEKFNCTGCHTFKMEQWRLTYADDTFEDPVDEPDFPFLSPHFSDEEVAASMAKDYAGLLRADVHGEPVIDAETGEKFWVDVDRAPITKEELVEAEAEEGETIPVFYQFTLWRNVLLNGKKYLRGVGELMVPADRDRYGPARGAAFPAWGGDLARYLYSKVVAKGKEGNPQLNAKEAWGWLPPPLMDEGWKVQPNWLHSFLMDPYPIRPAAVLRMPNFHMSSDDAASLVDYFAASSGVQFPYEYNPNQQPSYLTNLRREKKEPFGEAMKIVTNGNYCVKCHAVADFVPVGDSATFGPNLAEVYRRLRPEFTRDWIANPARILHYTGMPKNIPYYPDKPHLGGVDQSLFQGTSIQQVMGLVDLLMNFDAYAREQTSVTPQVEAAAAAAKAQAAAAEPDGAAEESNDEESPP